MIIHENHKKSSEEQTLIQVVKIGTEGYDFVMTGVRRNRRLRASLGFRVSGFGFRVWEPFYNPLPYEAQVLETVMRDYGISLAGIP